MRNLKSMLQRRSREHGTRPPRDEQRHLAHLGSDEGRMIPLAMLPLGIEGRVVTIHGGRELAGRLMDLGLTPKVKVKVTHTHNPGPLVVEVKDTRIALGRGVAIKIMVEEVQ